MLRRLAGTALAAALTAVPVTLDRPETPDGFPTLGLNELACSETTTCCPELHSLCIANGETKENRRPVSGVCTPRPN